MTDKFDLNGLSRVIRTPLVTTSMLVYYAISDRFTNNIRFLEENGCNVKMLSIILKEHVDDSEELAAAFADGYLKGVGPGEQPDPDALLALQYMVKYMEENKEEIEFKELLDLIYRHNAAEGKFEDVIFAMKASGYVHKASKPKVKSKYALLEKYTDDLVEKAANSKLDPLIGREKEVQRMVEILAHYKKRNPLLVGEAGVGKTQIVEGLASAIASDKVPDAIKGARIFSTSIAKLMAGTKFRGDLEEKVEALLKEVIQFEKDTGLQAYLFIDEIHQIVGAGNGGGNNGGADIANIIKPALANGDLAIIGATTQKEYKKSIQTDSALNRRFQVVKIEEPTDTETVEIIKKGIAPVLTLHHGVKFPLPVIKRAVELSSKYITNKAQPDKSISILDSIGARLRTTEIRPVAKINDVESIISAITGTPVSAFQQKSTKDSYVDLETELNKVVFGQSEAVSKIVEVYERSKAGLSEDGQPIGSILAIGPTGVGKTEVAQSLARLTESHFFKINMGEFTEEHSVAKLFGSPPGYVGFKDGGILTNEITKYPHTILLLDEIEKAHKKVFEALLGIIDGAKMTDGEGNVVDFRNVLIVMTSNVGAAQAARTKSGISLSGGSKLIEQAKAKVSEEALVSTFSPEFRNKLTAVINFSSLGVSEIRQVTDKFLNLAKERLKVRKGINVEFNEAVYDYINKHGFDPAFGARPIKKLVDSAIVDRLVRPILKGEIKSGDTVSFSVDVDTLVYTVLETVEV